MGTKVPKQFLTLGGLPVIVHTLRALEAADDIVEIILAVPDAEREYCRQAIVESHRLSKVARIVAGGEERQDSVRCALAAVSAGVEFVLVHDAVRPFVTTAMVRRVLDAAAVHGAAVVAIPMKDTVKQVGGDGLIERTVDRSGLWLAQTPQAFRRALFEEAHRQALAAGFRGTDDTQLVEQLGRPVAVVEGSGDNIKITRPEDFVIGEALLAERRNAGRS